MKVSKSIFASAFALALLAVPASAPAFAKEKAAKAAVVVQAPPAGQGQVVFFRPGSMMGMALGWPLLQNWCSLILANLPWTTVNWVAPAFSYRCD